jgi:hypothetical protein
MNLENVDNKIGMFVWNSVRDPMWKSVWDFLRDSVGNSVRDSVVVSVWNSVNFRLQDTIRQEREQG